MHLYQIKTTHWSGNEGRDVQEFVVADDMQQVINYIRTDLHDKGMQVRALVEEVPVTKILCKK